MVHFLIKLTLWQDNEEATPKLPTRSSFSAILRSGLDRAVRGPDSHPANTSEKNVVRSSIYAKPAERGEIHWQEQDAKLDAR